MIKHSVARVLAALIITLLPCLRGDRRAAGAARGEGTAVQRAIISSPFGGEVSRSGGGERVSLVRSAHAATSTLTTKKIKDVAMGQVIKVGDSKFVKVAANGWMAAEAYVGTATMQAFTKTACDAISTPASRTGYTAVATLADARDGKQYVIRKYADGHCWMAENLKFGNCASISGSTYETYRRSSVTNQVASGYYGTCRDAAAAGGNYDGYLYNWQAAMNNSAACYGCTFNNRANGSTTATHDICPLGWHVPTTGEFQSLANIVEGKTVGNSCSMSICPNSRAWFSATTNNAWNASGKSAMAGYSCGSTLDYQGTQIALWASTVLDNNSAYMLTSTNDYIYTYTHHSKNCGLSVRCIQDYTMQSFTKADCDAAPTPTSNTGYTPVATLTDARDGKQYVIRKYADGRCWMAQNLQFGNCAAINGDAYNTDSKTSVSNKVASGYYGTCRDAAEAGNYDGYLYNWQAAMNNSTAYYEGTFNGRTNGTTEATHDICPLGWHVPTKEEFQLLANKVQGGTVSNGCTNTDCANAHNFFYADGANAWNASGKSALAVFAYGSSLLGQGTTAHWWSSTVISASGADYLYLESSKIYPQFSDSKYVGFSVRCVADQ